MDDDTSGVGFGQVPSRPRACEHCSVLLPAASRRDKRFCSTRCMQRAQRGLEPMRLVTHCLYCGEPLGPCADPRRRYCSSLCNQRDYYDVSKVPTLRNCRNCGASLPQDADIRRQYCSSACQRDHYAVLNEAELRTKRLAWEDGNRDRLLSYQRARYVNDPERAKAARDRRRALMEATPGPHRFTDADWRSLLRQYGNACAYCCITGVALEKEHVVPLSRGGRDTVGNVVPACRPCNRAKGVKFVAEWRLQALRRTRAAEVAVSK